MVKMQIIISQTVQKFLGLKKKKQQKRQKETKLQTPNYRVSLI